MTDSSATGFSCSYFEGEGYYLNDSYDIECYEEDYLLTIWLVSIIGLIVWVICAPVLILR